jgi:hypothetical protein
MMINWFNRPVRWHYIPRRLMPQVDGADLTALMEWLAWKGIGVTSVTVQPSQLQFRQKVDYDKARTMPAAEYIKPVLISDDGVVLDGNHRAEAHIMRNEPEHCLKLSLPFQQAIGALFSFAGTYSYATYHGGYRA